MRRAASRAASAADPEEGNDADDAAAVSGDSSGSDFEPEAGASEEEDQASVMDLTQEDQEAQDLAEELQGLVR